MQLKMYGVSALIGETIEDHDRFAIPNVEENKGKRAFLLMCGPRAGRWGTGLNGECFTVSRERAEEILAGFGNQNPWQGTLKELTGLPPCLSKVEIFEANISIVILKKL